MTKINLGSHSLDLDKLINSRMLIQANSGGGKSWALRRLVEEVGKRQRFWLIDPEGEFFTLREQLDLVLVRNGGDVRPSVKTAGALATHLLEAGTSAVLDLSEFIPRERREWVRLFLESLLAAPQRLWAPLLVAIDEAHDFAPEKEEASSLHAVNGLMTKGRKRGFCGVLATQRLSKLAKDSAAECNNVLIGRCSLDVDQKRAADALGWGKAEAQGLRTLLPGCFMAFGPAFGFDAIKTVEIGLVATSHGREALKAARLPEPSEKIRSALPALAALDTPDPDRVDDLDTAKARIAELKGKLKRLEAAPQVVQDQGAIQRAVDAAIAEWQAKVDATAREFRLRADKAVAALSAPWTLPTPVPLNRTAITQAPYAPMQKVDRIVPPVPPRPTIKVPIAEGREPESGGQLAPRHRDILAALVWFEEVAGVSSPTKEQVAARIGMNARGGGFANYLGAMKGMGLIEYPSPGAIRITANGRAVPVHRMTGDVWQNLREVVGDRKFEILDRLRNDADGCTDRATLAEMVGMNAAGGGFANYLGALKTLAMISYPSPGEVALAEWLK